MRLVFCGTPSFAVPTFEALLAAGHEIALVVSQPDRPVGRSQQMTAPPVKQAALAAGLTVVLVWLALRSFRRMERQFADVI